MLSDEQIDAVTFAQLGDCQWAAYRAHARSIEAEVRGQDEALIRELVEALDEATTYTASAMWSPSMTNECKELVAKGRARLEGKT